MDARHVYKIVDQASWADARNGGLYTGSSDDRRDGFIHFSTAAQAPRTAAKFFAGRTDLVIAAVDAAALGDAMKWEPSRGGDLFPHLYGDLDIAAVRWTRPLPLGRDGRHVFPPEMI